jgi:hypothetical protein
MWSSSSITSGTSWQVDMNSRYNATIMKHKYYEVCSGHALVERRDMSTKLQCQSMVPKAHISTSLVSNRPLTPSFGIVAWYPMTSLLVMKQLLDGSCD